MHYTEILTESKARNYVLNKGWVFKESNGQLNLEVCPLCSNSNYKFYMAAGGEKDGAFDCKVCSESGGLRKLMEHEGDSYQGITSYKDTVGLANQPTPIPDTHGPHRLLMEDEEALDYLIAERGLSMDVVEKHRIGVEAGHNNSKWLLIPYLQNTTAVYIKYRRLPPVPEGESRFRGISGKECPLFNQECITKGMSELFMVEGEMDALSMISNGFTGCVGVPGANTQKTTWIKKIDDSSIQKIYILFDNDKVGQEAAKQMAKKIGIDKAYNILLPVFNKLDGTQGKDINEWFVSGHTAEEFRSLVAQARPFDVEGVVGIADAIDELEASFNGDGKLVPALITPWDSLTARLGGAEWGDLIGIIAEGKIGKSTMALNWLDYYSRTTGLNTLMLCLEMSPKRLVRKWVSSATQTDDTPGKSQITRDTLTDARKIAYESPGELLFGYLANATKETVFDLIRQTVRRYGVKVVCFDNLQYLARSMTHQTQELGILSKSFKDLAMELGIVILLIVQPNRVRDGEIVSAKNSNGSSAIEKDVDAMIALTRKRIAQVKESDLMGAMDTDDNFEPMLFCRVDLSRFAPGGWCTLWMDGCMSTVRELGEIEKDTVVKLNYGSAIPQEV